MALSGPRLAVTNRTAESWWLFLAKFLPMFFFHIVVDCVVIINGTRFCTCAKKIAPWFLKVFSVFVVAAVP